MVLEPKRKKVSEIKEEPKEVSSPRIVVERKSETNQRETSRSEKNDRIKAGDGSAPTSPNVRGSSSSRRKRVSWQGFFVLIGQLTNNPVCRNIVWITETFQNVIVMKKVQNRKVRRHRVLPLSSRTGNQSPKERRRVLLNRIDAERNEQLLFVFKKINHELNHLAVIS